LRRFVLCRITHCEQNSKRSRPRLFAPYTAVSARSIKVAESLPSSG
jgi:hypothetical protein